MQSLQTELRTLTIYILVSISIFLLENLSMLYYPKLVLLQVFSPIQYGIYQSGKKVYSQFEFLTHLKTLSRENTALLTQLSSLLVENATLRKDLEKVKSQLKQEQILNPATYKMVLASPVGLSRYLVLNVGSDNGITPGMPVVYQDTLIGAILDSTSSRSRVILTSDPDSKVGAFVTSTTAKTKGILIGRYGQEMLLDKILHQEPITTGDLVYTDGIDEKTPKGLVLGVVTEIISSDNQVFKQAKVRPLFKPDNLDTVFIITN